jgi:hypothetical protein
MDAWGAGDCVRAVLQPCALPQAFASCELPAAVCPPGICLRGRICLRRLSDHSFSWWTRCVNMFVFCNRLVKQNLWNYVAPVVGQGSSGVTADGPSAKANAATPKPEVRTRDAV